MLTVAAWLALPFAGFICGACCTRWMYRHELAELARRRNHDLWLKRAGKPGPRP